MRLLSLAVATTLLAVPIPAAIHAQTPSIAGTWTPAPLVESGKPDPETGGSFKSLGDAWLLSDGHLVFWARYGEQDKGGWALYSVREGAPRLVLRADEDFTPPDGIKKRYRLFDFGSTIGTSDLYFGKHAAFTTLQPGLNQESVYGVIGGTLFRLIGRGDTLRVGGTAAALKRVTIQDLTGDGQAVLHYWTEKPDDREGWLLHDGRTVTPLWTKGDAIPGEAAPIVIEGLAAGPERFGDTMLVVLDTKRQGDKRILYRLTPGRAERMLVNGEPSPVVTGKSIPYFRHVRATAGDRFVLGVEIDQFVSNRTRGFFAWQNDFRTRLVPLVWWQHSKGAWRGVMAPERGPPTPKNMLGPIADSVTFLRPGSDSLLIAGGYLSLGPRPLTSPGAQILKRVPGLWLFDGNGLRPVPLTGTTLDLATLADQMQKRSQLLNPFGSYPLPAAPGTAVAAIPGLLGGMRVIRSGEAALAEPARFTLDGATWPAWETDLVGWIDERTAVVRRQVLGVVMGYYRLVRQ